MTREEKIKALAEKVMGWEAKKVNDATCNFFVQDDDISIPNINKWDPFESWNDCGMLIEKVRLDINICQDFSNDGAWLIEVNDITKDNFDRNVSRNASPTIAITEAICSAYGID